MLRFATGLVSALAVTAGALGLSSAPGVAVQSSLVPVPCATREWTTPETPFVAKPGARAFTGKYDGGLYKIEIPEKWNGELVIWAHGLVSAGGEQGLRLREPDHPLRDQLIDRGFAWTS